MSVCQLTIWNDFVSLSAMDTVTQDPKLDLILDAAFRAFASYGYRRTSMEDIARGAGLSRTALYLHFRSKEDIFRSLAVRYFHETKAALRAALAGPGPLDAVLRAAFVAKDGKFMEIVMSTPHGAELLDAGTSVTADMAAEAEAEMAGIFADWVAARGLGQGVGSPQGLGQMILAALKGLKSDARGLEDYRARQAVLAAVLARALA